MTRIRTVGSAALLLIVLGAGTLLASWYDDYDAGVAAARKGQWSTVIQKMNAAIGGHGKEGNNERTYGNIFISYHPYYYRGLAYLQTGKFEQAVADFEKTQGPGEYDAGSLDTLMQRAKTKLAEASTPEPTPTPTPTPTPVPVKPVVPAAPTIDPALRTQANNAIRGAQAKVSAAQGRNASAAQGATQALTSAINAFATAASNDELRRVIQMADNAASAADLVQANAPPPVVKPAPPVVAQTKPTAATDVVLGDAKQRLRSALEHYFNGDFDEAESGFRSLSTDMPTNAWIWAFLGASQYSQYAFEADAKYKDAALESFRKAKQLRTWKGGLPQRYFSKKIRRVFDSLG